ncbi:NADP-dependent oxidoreductase domain-containing protein [Schizophyllum fasciatum]
MTFGTITLNDGNSIPAIAYDTGSKWKYKSVVEFVATATETGFSHLDTAQLYLTEPDVGQAIRESGLARSEFFVTTKFGGGDVQEEFDKSLHKVNLNWDTPCQIVTWLQTSRIVGEKGIAGTWLELEISSAVGEPGMLAPLRSSHTAHYAIARSIGVSNFTVDHLETVAEVSTITPVVNQIHLHPYNYADMETVHYCSAHGIVVEAYSGLDPITKFPGGPIDAPLIAAASRRGATMVQALFLWVRAKGVTIVTTSSTRAHMEEYMAVGNLEPLSNEEVAAIDEAGRAGPPLLNVKMLARRQLLTLRRHRTGLLAFAVLLLLVLGTGWRLRIMD